MLCGAAPELPQQGRLSAPAALRQLPQSARSQSVRNQSRRYLQHTLTKLSEDSLRIGRRLRSEDAWSPTSLPPLQKGKEVQALGFPLEQPQQPWELPRNLIAELPGKAIIEVPPGKSVIEVPSSEATELASAMRAAGANEDAGPDELSKAAEEAPEATTATNAGSCSRRGSTGPNGGTDGEIILLDEDNPNLPMAMLAVARVICAWEAEVRATADVWRLGLSEQAKLREITEDRWRKLHTRLDLLQERLEEMGESLCQQQTRAMEMQGELEAKVEASGLHAVEAADNARQAVDALARSAAGDSESIKRHVTELLAGTLEKTDGGQKSIGQQMKYMSDKLTGLNKNEEFLRETADKWQCSFLEAQSEIKRLQGESHEAREQTQILEDNTAELRQQLQKVQQVLEKTLHAPGADLMRKFKELESRGNLRIDRQTGRVELARPLDFVPPVPAADSSTSEVVDVTAAQAVVADLAEIWGLLKVPVQVEVQVLPGKSGKPDFWEQVAGSQAAYISQELGRTGVPTEMLTTKGSLVPKGSKVGNQFLQFHPDIFPSVVVAKGAGKGGAGKGGASKSPKRK